MYLFLVFAVKPFGHPEFGCKDGKNKGQSGNRMANEGKLPSIYTRYPVRGIKTIFGKSRFSHFRKIVLKARAMPVNFKCGYSKQAYQPFSFFLRSSSVHSISMASMGLGGAVKSCFFLLQKPAALPNRKTAIMA